MQQRLHPDGDRFNGLRRVFADGRLLMRTSVADPILNPFLIP
jgi:hypothetical protein